MNGREWDITNIEQQYDVWVSLNTLLVNGMMIKCEHLLGKHMSARTFIRYLWEGLKESTLHVTYFASFCSIYSNDTKNEHIFWCWPHLPMLSRCHLFRFTLIPTWPWASESSAFESFCDGSWTERLSRRRFSASLSFSATAVACACALEGNLWAPWYPPVHELWLFIPSMCCCSFPIVFTHPHVSTTMLVVGVCPKENM